MNMQLGLTEIIKSLGMVKEMFLRHWEIRKKQFNCFKTALEINAESKEVWYSQGNLELE
jgi:hypothetical protein